MTSQIFRGRENLRAQALVQKWYDILLERLPAETSLVANVQEAGEGGFLVSFRAESEEQTLISEARHPDPALAVTDAAEGLIRRLEEGQEISPRRGRFLREAS